MSKSKETNANSPTWPVSIKPVGIVRLKKGAPVYTWVEDRSIFATPTPLYVIGCDQEKVTLKLVTPDFTNVCEVYMSDVQSGFTCQVFGDLILPDDLNLGNKSEIISYIEKHWGSDEEYMVKRELIIEQSLMAGFLIDETRLDLERGAKA